MIDAEQEAARTPSGPAFADAVTFSFADAAAGVYGLARLGISGEGASALAVLFSGREPVAALAVGGLDVEGEAWDAVAAGGLRTTVEEPLARWTVALEGEEHGFELAFEAIGPAAQVSDEFVGAGGMSGYEQICLVTGAATVGGRRVEVRCLGQRGHAWGEPDWTRLEAARTVSAWIEDGPALALQSVRARGRGARRPAHVGGAARPRRGGPDRRPSPLHDLRRRRTPAACRARAVGRRR